MKSLVQQALGKDWETLAPALQAHYRFGTTVDTGSMDIEYPLFMQPIFSFLRIFGVLVNRPGRNVSTVVKKQVVGERQYWQRTIRYKDGKEILFNSHWESSGENRVIEYVNSFLGLQMEAWVEQEQLRYRGINYIVKLGKIEIAIPQWLSLGYASIVEEAVDETHFVMDFRLSHPLFGQLFRYSGKFEADSQVR